METTRQATNAMEMENIKDFLTALFNLQDLVQDKTKVKFDTPAFLGYVYLVAAGKDADPQVLNILGVGSFDHSVISQDDLNTFVQYGNELSHYVLTIRRFSLRYAATMSDELQRLIMHNLLHVSENTTVYLPFAGIASFVDICPNATYIGEELNETIWALGKIRAFFMQQANVHIACANSLEAQDKYDTIVAMPPFGMRRDTSIPAIIESLYNRLNDGGQMAIVVPAGFLIEVGVKAARIKKILLEQHALYRVILLPGDLLANTSISVAILLIQRNGGGDTITLTDYSDFIKDNRKYGTLCKLDMEAIEDAEKTALLHELEGTTPQARFQIRIKFEDLLQDDVVNLNPKYHINRTHILSNKANDMQYIHLGDLVEIYAQAKLFGGSWHVPVVRIQDLADTILTGKKDFLDLEVEEVKEKNIPVLMEDNLLLVGLVGKTLKPTIFKLTNGRQIAYSENIAPLRLKSSQVTVEYLQCELASDFVLEQLLAYQVGGGRQFISRRNLLDIYIRVPNLLDQQKRIVDESRELLSNDLIQKLGIENEELRNARYNEFVREMRVRKHAIGQVLNELDPAIDMLMLCKDKNGGVLRGSDIVSSRSGYTVDEYMQKVRFLVNKVMTMVDSLTMEYAPKSEMQDYNLVQLLEEYKQNHSVENSYELIIKHGYFASELHMPAGIELPDGSVTEELNVSQDDYCDFWKINVCKEDFFQVLDNIISNAKRYGFTGNRPDYCICFEMEDVRDDKTPMVAIHVKNNGNPLPAGIKPEQVFMYGEGSAQGTGIGGWQIKQSVEGMGGKVELRTYDADEDGYSIDYVLSFPDKSVGIFMADNLE